MRILPNTSKENSSRELFQKPLIFFRSGLTTQIPPWVREVWAMEDKEDDRMPGTVVDSRVQAPWEGEPVLSLSLIHI